jgi:hypothetical protein
MKLPIDQLRSPMLEEFAIGEEGLVGWGGVGAKTQRLGWPQRVSTNFVKNSKVWLCANYV